MIFCARRCSRATRARRTSARERSSEHRIILQCVRSADRRPGGRLSDLDRVQRDEADADAYADFNGSGTLQTRYLYGPGVITGAVVDEILARTSSGGTTVWYLPDNVGSVRDVVSSSGSLLDHIVYDSFGNILTETNSSNGDRFKFAGMQYDATTGQYFDHARWYLPSIGRFDELDALGFAAGDPNQFRYVGDDVLDEVDPSGKMPYRYPIDSRIAGQLISSLWDYFFPQPPQPLGPNGTATPQQFLQSDMLPVQSDATVNLLRGGCVDLLKWRYGLDGPPELSPNTVLYKDWESMYKAWQGLEGKGFYYRTMLIHMSNQLTDKDYTRMLKDAAHGIMDPVKTYFAVRSSASYNFASLRVTGDPKTPVFYWEWMNHSLMSHPGGVPPLIKHRTTMPGSGSGTNIYGIVNVPWLDAAGPAYQSGVPMEPP